MNHFYSSRKPLLLFVLLFSFSTLSFANTYTVVNTNANGPGSLEQAILDANLNPGPDVIAFAILGPPPYVITPGFPGLTAITGETIVDGYSQPGAAIGPIYLPTRIILITINGALAGNSSGLTVSADNVTISGLAINGFLGDGINVTGGFVNTWIWGNFIGTDLSGTVAAGNGRHGINMGDLGPGGSDAIVIGTNSDGTNDDSEGNLISDNGLDGIVGWALTNSIISGNFIGSDRTGAGTTFGNGRNGILLTVNSTDNRIGTNGDNVNDVQELNGLILNGTGISLINGSNGNIIAGNSIGVNTAQAAAGNLGDGIYIVNSSDNRIGVDVSHANFIAESNIISSNAGRGINFEASTTFGSFVPISNNVVAGNFIGTTPTNANLGNGGNGINFTSANGILNTNNLVGSNNDGTGDDAEGNVIAYNGVFGIAIGSLADPTTTDVSGINISRNSIHDNSSLGIDIVGTIGVTANDNGDGDTGPNELFNFPVILNSMNNGTHLWVAGITGPSTIVEVYLSDGSGEGGTFLFRAQEGTMINNINDDLAGTDSYSDPVYGTFTDNEFRFVVPLANLPVAIPPGAVLVAIGIKPAAGDNSTSEFGPAMVTLPVTLTNFKGQLVDGVVKLNWSTSREIGASHFVIEKSLDGTSYSSIGQVNTGAATGQYSFTDRTSLGKINYYRLKMVDLNQNFTYTKVLIVRNDAELIVFKLSPNPVSSYLNVSFRLEKDEVIRLNVFDQMGRVAKRYTLQGSRGINAFTISDLGNLSSGNYVVEIVGESISVKQQIMKK